MACSVGWSASSVVCSAWPALPASGGGVKRIVGGLQRVASAAWLPVSGGRVRTVGGLLRVASAERLLEVECVVGGLQLAAGTGSCLEAEGIVGCLQRAISVLLVAAGSGPPSLKCNKVMIAMAALL
ncbi:hypothetical protein PHYPSEUDO_004849 [Phytophthora pseudosyringae]|uniref:Uncharacterized protein n=1 Tax=Phytophthora pseudosyringae TaxID=221518 RepID=A0A8T1VME4_9STRA|nr:hypothetical protein PHYPSEUDO_004849 [Phytophthora pseudosyringae]